MDVNAPLGTESWREEVFSSLPARDVRGRSRPTQRYIVNGLDGLPSVAEGGNASVARALLTTAILAGQVTRLKLEPFALAEKVHGISAIPDIIFEWRDRRIFVLEVKSARYLTAAKAEKCRSVERVIAAAGMTYLLWTDVWPLTPGVWNLMRAMRRCGTCSVTADDLQRVHDLVAEMPRTFAELRERGLYRDCVLSAAWHGRAHFDLFTDLSDQTLVSANPEARRLESVLTATADAQLWWSTLSRV